MCGYEFWEEEEILDNDMKPKEEIPFPFCFTYYYTMCVLPPLTLLKLCLVHL